MDSDAHSYRRRWEKQFLAVTCCRTTTFLLGRAYHPPRGDLLTLVSTSFRCYECWCLCLFAFLPFCVSPGQEVSRRRLVFPCTLHCTPISTSWVFLECFWKSGQHVFDTCASHRKLWNYLDSSFAKPVLAMLVKKWYQTVRPKKWASLHASVQLDGKFW